MAALACVMLAGAAFLGYRKLGSLGSRPPASSLSAATKYTKCALLALPPRRTHLSCATHVNGLIEGQAVGGLLTSVTVAAAVQGGSYACASRRLGQQLGRRRFRGGASVIPCSGCCQEGSAPQLSEVAHHYQ